MSTTNQPLISLASDFGVQTQGVGTMEATVHLIAPQARVIHLMHGIPDFDIAAAARTMESLHYFPVGYHVCVCDPGVGTKRRAIAIEVTRGDVLVGPDNGVLVPAMRMLGGFQRAHELTNPEYMRQPVSCIFHGRDIFAPAAAHLANGVDITEFGVSVPENDLTPAPYNDANIENNAINAKVIQINKFGSFHLNVTHETWDSTGLAKGDTVRVRGADNWETQLPVCETFGDVAPQHNLIMKDDFGRIEIAKNLGAFVSEFPVSIGDQIQLSWG